MPWIQSASKAFDSIDNVPDRLIVSEDPFDRCCIDEPTQIAAVQAARDKVALGLLDDHADPAWSTAVPRGTPEELADELMAAVGAA